MKRNEGEKSRNTILLKVNYGDRTFAGVIYMFTRPVSVHYSIQWQSVSSAALVN
jgi:hypothetical protein